MPDRPLITRRAATGVGLAALAMCMLAVGVLVIGLATPGQLRSDAPVEVQVLPGSTARQIGAVLERTGLVRSAFAFDVAVRLMGKAGSLKAGEYRFQKGAGLFDIIDAMARGAVAQVRVTLAEGLTASQMAQILEDGGIVPAGAFMDIVASPPDWVSNEFPFVPAGVTLEGYLFPDTYYFARDVQASSVVRTMLRQYQAVVQSAFAAAADGDHGLLPSGLNTREALILASIVEREARLAHERPIIAGVFLRRLDLGMALQSCATVQYVLPSQKERLTFADTQIDSPYNTYVATGLPPGPISNPGKASVQAVIEPEDGNALYFVAAPDGSHVFTSNYAEHLRAKALIEREARR